MFNLQKLESDPYFIASFFFWKSYFSSCLLCFSVWDKDGRKIILITKLITSSLPIYPFPGKPIGSGGPVSSEKVRFRGLLSRGNPRWAPVRVKVLDCQGLLYSHREGRGRGCVLAGTVEHLSSDLAPWALVVPQAASEVFTRPVGVHSVGSAEKWLRLHPWLEGCRINLTAAARGWSERRDSLRRAQETGWLAFQHLGQRWEELPGSPEGAEFVIWVPQLPLRIYPSIPGSLQ